MSTVRNYSNLSESSQAGILTPGPAFWMGSSETYQIDIADYEYANIFCYRELQLLKN